MTHSPDAVRALVLDCDGVLTDGTVWVDDDGRESRRFSVRDGFGIALWTSLGLRIAVISGRGGASLRHRMAQLGVHDVVQSSADKEAAIRDAAARLGVAVEHCAFMGDDWPDLPAMAVSGYPIAVADATAHVKACAAWVTTARGGGGAVREAIEHILKAKGLLEGGAANFASVRSTGRQGPSAG
jgi:3-deoxy-D-manno-octulosonate 8-phosphate phosphatase (KDO 8-P phosphatase)